VRATVFLRVVFIVYCLQIGVFLVLSPWSPAWEKVIFQLSALPGFQLALTPTLRGVVTGFGLLHLVWGAHDLDALFGRAATDDASEPAADPRHQ
jgi:hypothetical protein